MGYAVSETNVCQHEAFTRKPCFIHYIYKEHAIKCRGQSNYNNGK